MNRLHGLLLSFSVIALLAPAGCGKKDDKSPQTPAAADPRIKEGWLFHTPDERHLRLRIDKVGKEIRALMLDSNPNKIQPVDAKTLKLNVLETDPPIEVILRARPEKDDGAGKCSVFVGWTDNLPEKIDKKKLVITTVIEGKNSSFKWDEGHDQ